MASIQRPKQEESKRTKPWPWSSLTIAMVKEMAGSKRMRKPCGRRPNQSGTRPIVPLRHARLATATDALSGWPWFDAMDDRGTLEHGGGVGFGIKPKGAADPVPLGDTRSKIVRRVF